MLNTKYVYINQEGITHKLSHSKAKIKMKIAL